MSRLFLIFLKLFLEIFRYYLPLIISPAFTSNGILTVNNILGCGADSIGTSFSSRISSRTKLLAFPPGEIISAVSPQTALFRCIRVALPVSWSYDSTVARKAFSFMYQIKNLFGILHKLYKNNVLRLNRYRNNSEVTQ